MKRRTVIKNLSLSLASVPLASSFLTYEKLLNNPVGKGVGIQLFTIPKLLDEDFKGTLELLKKVGYKELEFFGPYPFSSEETKQGWVPIKNMLGLKNDAFFGYSVDDTVNMLADYELEVPSMHTDIVSLRTGFTKLLDGLSRFNTQYVTIPAILNIEERNTKDHYLKLAEEFNSIGEKLSAYDMKFVYHNHGYEHVNYDGEEGLDILLKNTDTRFVQFELDIFWMQAAGVDPVKYLEMYPGKFKMLHIKDAIEPFRFSGDGGTPEEWMTGFPKMTDPGNGVFNIPEIIKAAASAGVEHYFLERDLAPEPADTIKNSYQYLKKLV